MFRYVFSLLLMNTYYSSFGNSMPVSTVNHNQTFLSDSLAILSSTCENILLAEQIKVKTPECNITVPPYKKKQFQCLMFYDINSQLCNAVKLFNLTLTEEDIKKISQVKDVTSVCQDVKNWNFMNLTAFPPYQQFVKLIKTEVKCEWLCVTEEITSQDANFFCSYYRWGSEVLSMKQVNNAPLANLSLSTVSSDLSAAPNGSNTINKIDIVDSDKLKNNPTDKSEISNNTVSEEHFAKTDTVKSTPTKQDIAPSPQSVSPEKAEEKKVVQRPPILPEQLPKEDHVIQTGQDDKEKVVIEKAKEQGSETDDYTDSEEAKDNFPDTQGGDDGDDPNLDIKPDIDIKSNPGLDATDKRIIETPLSSFNGDTAQREIFPNTMPDGFSEDEDHFFPFFLTAVILVVLLYVLYHNKNKVTKVVLGLIVEGRQPNRRRNSRGHAYRRLDTLEQAMSANTAAPPSKIIY